MNDGTDVPNAVRHPLVPEVMTEPRDAVPGLKEIVEIASGLANAAHEVSKKTTSPGAAAGAGIMGGQLDSIVAICAMMVECMP